MIGSDGHRGTEISWCTGKLPQLNSHTIDNPVTRLCAHKTDADKDNHRQGMMREAGVGEHTLGGWGGGVVVERKVTKEEL